MILCPSKIVEFCWEPWRVGDNEGGLSVSLIYHQGMLTVTSEVATSPKIFLNLWKHECNRVIADRFTNQQDKDWFEKALKQVVEEDFDSETSSLLEAEPYFVDFMRDAPEPTGITNLLCQFLYFI